MNKILTGDCRETLKQLDAGSVQTCVTSPPYYGLRDYGTAKWEGGDPACDHSPEKRGGRFATPVSSKQASNAGSGTASARNCSCGAVRVDKQIGLEETPEQYVEKLVQVFREVRRVLKDDGCVWLNLGDSYAANRGYQVPQTKDAGTKRGDDSFNNMASVTPNLRNILESLVKDSTLFIGSGNTLTISAEGKDVLSSNGGAPNSKFPSLLGVKRITIKQRNNNLSQVFDLLDPEACRRICIAMPFTVVKDSNAEIILDEGQSISIIVSNHDLNTQSSFGIAIRTYTTINPDMPLSIKEAAKPTSKTFSNSQAAGDTVSLDSFGESGLNINSVNEPVALRDTLMPGPKRICNLRVTKASQEHVAFLFMDGIIKFACGSVGHLYFSNSFGSVVRYAELYDKANRMSNASQSKQLLGIPWMVARALQEDGWILRSDVIWAKPNPMPESVTDRPTKSHEYIFLLSKSAQYYYDHEAILEHATYAGDDRKARASEIHKRMPDEKTNGIRPRKQDELGKRQYTGFNDRYSPLDFRNKRDVWTVTTKPYPEAHFATFPPDLIESCILAGSRPGDIVLDPFGGSGTTAAVAVKHHRNYVICELNPSYVKLAEKRITSVQPVLLGI